jgi:hypothetical protein
MLLALTFLGSVLLSAPGFNTPAASAALAAAAAPELPRTYVNTTYVPPTGRTIAVTSGGSFQDALNQAQPGDVITLQAGATFSGNFVLPNKSGFGWIIIRSSTADANLPPIGTRITSAYANVLPKIVTPNSMPAITAADGAHNYRFIGVEVTMASSVTRITNLAVFGDEQTSLAQLPRDIILDRVYFHGSPTATLRRAMHFNPIAGAVIDSYISDCHEVGADSQAILVYNTPGPLKFVNNYLEGAGENFMSGGSDPRITGLVPSDIEFRNNHCFKPLSWKADSPSFAGIRWSVKNLFELKNAQRVLIDGNLFENNWAESQAGFAILFTVRNDGRTAPWSTVQDVTFSNNVVRGSGSGVNMHGQDDLAPSQPTKRIRIVNNLFDDINGPRWGNAGGRLFQIINSPSDVAIEHNTGFQSGHVAMVDSGTPAQNFVFRDNIMPNNDSGFFGSGQGTGTQALNYYFPGAIFTKNVLVGGQSSQYPAGNFFPSSMDQVGFTNRVARDYRLLSTSPYANAASDGRDIGCLFGQSTTTPPPPPPPTISNVSTSGVTFSGVTVTWATSAMCDSQVEYGTSTAYGNQSPLNPTLLTNHVVSLSGLNPNTLYNYRVKSRDNAGNMAMSANLTFTTAASPPSDTTPPVISGVSATNVTSTSATIVWATNEASDSQVEYGTTTAYGSQTPVNPTMLTNHAVTLSGLSANTVYNFRVKSRDGAGNAAASMNATFVTPPSVPSDTTPPVIAGVSAANITGASATIVWVTNEASDSQVEYGTTTAYGQQTAFNGAALLNHAQTINGLAPDTVYQFRVKSRDAAGNLAVSGNFSFRTVPAEIPVLTGQPVIWSNLHDLVLTGGTLQKVSGCNGCYSSAISQQSFSSGNGYVEFSAADRNQDIWVSLTNRSRPPYLRYMDFAIAIWSDGRAEVRERGYTRARVAYNQGDVFRIAYENGRIRYYRNGALFFTSGRTPVYPVGAAAVILTVGGRVNNAVIGAGGTVTTATAVR